MQIYGIINTLMQSQLEKMTTELTKILTFVESKLSFNEKKFIVLNIFRKLNPLGIIVCLNCHYFFRYFIFV